MRTAEAALAVALAIGCSSAAAINRCTQKDGRVVYQETPCETGADAAAVKTWGAGIASPGARQTTAAGSAVRRERLPSAALQAPPEAAQLMQVYRRWIDAERLATSTGRIALAGPVASLQAAARDAEAASVPACLSEAKKRLVELTSRSVTAFIDFMQTHEVSAMTYTLIDREKVIGAFEEEVQRAQCNATASR